jgi:hypothetical protein
VGIRGQGEEKTFNPNPVTFSPNQFLVQNAYPNPIELSVTAEQFDKEKSSALP